MSLTLREMKTRLRLLTGELVDAAEAEVLLQDRYAALVDEHPWSQVKDETTITTVPQRGNGTIAIAAGTPTLATGTGTTFAAGDVGSFFRVGTDIGFLRVTAVDPIGQVLTLEAAYPNPPVAAGSTYQLFKTFYALPANLRRIDDAVEWFALSEWSVDDLSRADPQRTFTGSNPIRYVYRGLDANNAVQIELWPIPTAATTVRIPYLKRAQALSDESGALTATALLPSSLILACTIPDALSIALVKETNSKRLLALGKLLDRWEKKAEEELEKAQHIDLGLQGAVRPWMPMGKSPLLLDDMIPTHDSESWGLP